MGSGRPSNLRINVTSDSQPARRDLQQLDEDVTKGMGKFAGVGKAAGLAAGVALGAALIDGFSKAFEQNKANSKLAAQLGLTGPEAKEIGRETGKLWSNGIVDSVEEAAATIRAVVGAGLVPRTGAPAELDSIATKVADVATAFEDMGADVNNVSVATAQLLRTKLAPDATRALDAITKAYQRLGPQADDVLDSITEYSVQFQALGLSAEEAFGIFIQGTQAGARNTDLLADTLKEFALNAVVGSDAIREGYKKLGLDGDLLTKQFAAGGESARTAFQKVLDGLRAVKSPQDQNNIALDLFATKAEDVQKALLAIDPKTAVQALGDTTNAATVLGDTLRDNTTTQIDVFIRQMQQALVDAINTYAMPALSAFVTYLSDSLIPTLKAGVIELANTDSGLGSITGKFTGLKEPARQTWDQIVKMGNAFRDLGTELKPVGEQLGPLATLVGGALLAGLYAVAFVLGSVAKALIFLIDTIKSVWGWLKDFASFWANLGDNIDDVWGALKGLWDWLSGKKWSFPSFDIPGINLMSAAGAPGAGGMAMRAGLAAAVPLPPITWRSTTNVTVQLDSAVIQRIAARTTQQALLADGARLSARGWA